MAQPLTLAQLTERLNITLPKGANPQQTITAVKPLLEATAGELTFLDNPKYTAAAQKTNATAAFVTAENAQYLPATTLPLITPEPYFAFAQALMLMYPQTVSAGIHPTAVIADSAEVDPTAEVGAHTVIGANTTIGAHTKIDVQVCIQHATIGKNCIIHPGAKIGQDGFGFAEHNGEIHKIPQIGTVVIGDNVEVGANTTIDRGALGTTTIGSGTKLDNQVQIGHNVTLGENVRICGQSGIAGSATLGKNCLIGAQSGVGGHINLAPYTSLASKSALSKSIAEPQQTYAGIPAIPIQQWRRQVVSAQRSATAAQNKSNQK